MGKGRIIGERTRFVRVGSRKFGSKNPGVYRRHRRHSGAIGRNRPTPVARTGEALMIRSSQSANVVAIDPRDMKKTRQNSAYATSGDDARWAAVLRRDSSADG